MLKRGTMALAAAWILMSVITGIAQQHGGPPQPSPANKKLGVFVGTWKDEAEVKPGPLGPGGKMSLTETCDWFSGSFSVVCHTDTTGFMGDLKTLTVLTYDVEDQIYRFYELNSLGWSDSAKGTVDGDSWTFDSETKMGGKLIQNRFKIKLPSPNSATMNSDVSVDGGPWTPVMDLKASRVKQDVVDSHACVPHASEGWIFECFRRWLGSGQLRDN